MRRKLLTASLLSTFLLNACHHDNPLKTQTKHKSAAFLMNASANVEKRLYFRVKENEHGYGYLECMEGKNPDIHCKALYQGMVNFAKEGHYKGFESITLKDLTDQTAFTLLNNLYYEVMVSTWPRYYPVTR